MTALKAFSFAMSIPVILFGMAIALACIVCATRGVDHSRIFTGAMWAFTFTIAGIQMCRWGLETITSKN